MALQRKNMLCDNSWVILAPYVPHFGPYFPDDCPYVPLLRFPVPVTVYSVYWSTPSGEPIQHRKVRQGWEVEDLSSLNMGDAQICVVSWCFCCKSCSQSILDTKLETEWTFSNLITHHINVSQRFISFVALMSWVVTVWLVCKKMSFAKWCVYKLQWLCYGRRRESPYRVRWPSILLHWWMNNRKVETWNEVCWVLNPNTPLYGYIYSWYEDRSFNKNEQ